VRTRAVPQNAMKQRALRLLKQKKLYVAQPLTSYLRRQLLTRAGALLAWRGRRYEAQRDQALQQSFNIEQAHMASQSLQTTLQAVRRSLKNSVRYERG